MEMGRWSGKRSEIQTRQLLNSVNPVPCVAACLNEDFSMSNFNFLQQCKISQKEGEVNFPFSSQEEKLSFE